MTKKPRQNLKILRTKRAFEVKLKAFFFIFKGLLVVKNCLRPESAPLRSANEKREKAVLGIFRQNVQ